LNRSAWWIDLFHRAAAAPLAVGPQDAVSVDWLHANVYFVEAKVLIEGADEARAPATE
jgi:hypothetical protein